MLLFSAWQRSSGVEQGTHKPLVASSNLAAATNLPQPSIEQGTVQNPQACLAITVNQGITIPEAINSFLYLLDNTGRSMTWKKQR
jgi:hypothetical protein